MAHHCNDDFLKIKNVAHGSAALLDDAILKIREESLLVGFCKHFQMKFDGSRPWKYLLSARHVWLEGTLTFWIDVRFSCANSAKSERVLGLIC